MTQDDRTHVSSFAWLNVTQFLGALNDNVFKLLIVFFLVHRLGHELNTTQALATAIFVVPFLLFSHAAGVIADRFSKRHIVVAAKIAELAVMACGLVGLLLGNAFILYALLFVMCTQSAFFGPSKYGIIPELVGEHRLSQANSFLVSLSYLAIIIGTFLPSLFVDVLFKGNYPALAIFCVAVAGLGLAASWRIEVTPAVGARHRFTPWFVADVFKTFLSLRRDAYLYLAVIATAYFLFLGAFIQQALLYYGVETMGLSVEKSGYFFPMAALGIGLGALLSGRLSGRNIEFGIVPLGAIGLTLCCIAMNLIPATPVALVIVVFLVGFSSGLYIVPLNAFIQQRAPRERRGEILACSNFMSFLGAALSAVAFFVMSRMMHLTPGHCFVTLGILTGILAAVTLWLLPDFLVRFLILLITRTFYRIRVVGAEHVPTSGGALLVSNHVTWVDSLLIAATQQRRVRFVMAREIFRIPWVKPLFCLMGVIPVSPQDPPHQVADALQQARKALDDGFLVCVFAEGAITRNGNMRAFKPGIERIAGGGAHPIIPVYIGGAWGSIFSYYKGKLLAALPRRIPYPVSVLFGAPLPSTSSSADVRLAVSCLSGDAVDLLKYRRRTLPHMLVRRARRFWFRHAMSDTLGRSVSFGRALTGALLISRELRPLVRGQDKVGVVLPTSVGGVLTNVALTLLGKVPVNLNYTASASAVASAVRQCEIKTIVSSRAFLAKLESFEAPPGTVFIEDVVADVPRSRKIQALLKAILLPPALMREPGKRVGPDDVATIIFSSGSTAEPKGVMLSHHNIISNIEAVRTVFRFEPQDRICAVLPFFHSFGFTVTMWAPLVCGFSAYYHPNPLDGGRIGEMCREHKLTTIVATPTFLLAYIRRATPEDFATFRAVVTGAEKLTVRVADAFEKKFGIRPREGYGATELSPVAAMNLPDVMIAGVRQQGVKEGSVGHPLPGVAMRVCDPDTGVTLPVGEQGLLEVRGPNVMLGYLNDPAKTNESLRNGWYNTGDIAEIDRDGFVSLMDRLSRYSKIGGEMVPHIAIEDAILEAIGATEPVVAVTAAPDPRKGEQVVVFFTAAAGTADELYAALRTCDIPNLWKPKREGFVEIDAIPALGTGKRDLKSLRAMARDYCENRPGTVQRAVDKLNENL